MNKQKLVYRIPGAVWSLEFPADAVALLTAKAQRRWWSKERVGQLYSADLTGSVVEVNVVTALASKSSSYASVRLDMPEVVEERAKQFETGLHCLGFWHTHPEPVPQPSPADIGMAADHARAAKDVFAGIVFIIVGTARPPDGIGVWVHDGRTLWRALPET
jgi:proteasome lid subunit RPN8/RPN11